VGLNPSQLKVSPGKLADQLPPDRPEPSLDAAANPLAIEQNAAITQVQSQLQGAGTDVLPAVPRSGPGRRARYRNAN
jgi:hypothetical protein